MCLARTDGRMTDVRISKSRSAAARKWSYAFHRWIGKKFQTLSSCTLICLTLIYMGTVDLLLVRPWCLEGLILYRKQTFGGVIYFMQLCTYTKRRPGILLTVLFRENQDDTCLYFQGLAKNLILKLFLISFCECSSFLLVGPLLSLLVLTLTDAYSEISQLR